MIVNKLATIGIEVKDPDKLKVVKDDQMSAVKSTHKEKGQTDSSQAKCHHGRVSCTSVCS
jgi:hypothetical protein